MAAHFWKAAVVTALLLQTALAAPQGISVYSSVDNKGEQHTSVVPLNQQQSQALASQHLAQLNQQQSAISSLFGGLIGGNIFGPLVAVPPVPAPQHHHAAPAPTAPAANVGGGVAVQYSTDSQGNTHESVQHLNAQQAQQQFLENQQRLQAIFAASNPFGNFGFNPWLIPPLPFGFPFGFPFGPPLLPLPAFAYLPAALAANANNIVNTANQAAVNGAQRARSTVDAVVSTAQKAVKDVIDAAAPKA